MSVTLQDFVGLEFPCESVYGTPGVGRVTRVSPHTPGYLDVLVTYPGGEQRRTTRQAAHLYPYLRPERSVMRKYRVALPASQHTVEEVILVEADSPDAAKKSVRDQLGLKRLPAGVTVSTVPEGEPERPADKPASKRPARKVPEWKSLPDKKLAAHLLSHLTLPDSSWKDRRPEGVEREKGEKRDAFIRRVLLGEEAAS